MRFGVRVTFELEGHTVKRHYVREATDAVEALAPAVKVAHEHGATITNVDVYEVHREMRGRHMKVRSGVQV